MASISSAAPNNMSMNVPNFCHDYKILQLLFFFFFGTGAVDAGARAPLGPGLDGDWEE